MTLSELQRWRKAVPFFITVFCLLPWFLVRQDNFSQAQMPYTVMALAIVMVAPFLYVVLKLREPRWKREMEEYLGANIKSSLITLIPQDLNIAVAEREQLVNSEIYKELTGIFWEAIDQSQVLQAQKEHFYSNGVEYSTAIDAFLLSRFFGLCYLLASVVFGDFWLFLVGTCLALVALVARCFAIPRARRHHLELSAEQLDLLKRERGDFVADRFRQIVSVWRVAHHVAHPGVYAKFPKSKRSAMWDLSIVVVVLATAAFGVVTRGWLRMDSRAKSGAEVRSSYVTKGVQKKPFVVVFVHGIFGTKEDTWLSPGSGGSFPELLATDPEVKDKVDVFAFEYFTPKLGPAPSIVDLADQLRGELDDQHVFEDHQRVAFLAHSMGGIVVRQFLLSNQDRMLKVSMVFFYATPTNGSDLASIARLASANPQLRGMLPIEGNDFLQSIQSGWLNSDKAKSIASYCGVEELPTLGVTVVTRSSATSLCNRGLDPFSTDHLEIVKPTSRSDPRYTRFVTALHKEILDTDARPANQGSFPTSAGPTAEIAKPVASDPEIKDYEFEVDARAEAAEMALDRLEKITWLDGDSNTGTGTSLRFAGNALSGVVFGLDHPQDGIPKFRDAAFLALMHEFDQRVPGYSHARIENSTQAYIRIKSFCESQPSYEDVDRKLSRAAVAEAIKRLRNDVQMIRVRK